jgi:hypothetical protein
MKTTLKMKKLVTMAAVMACSVPAFAFTAGQSQVQINQEVAARMNKGETLETIAQASKTAGVVVNPVALALTFYGSADAVLAAMMNAGYDAAAVVNSLAALGGDRNALVATAIAKGADPTSLTAATAAGGNPNNNANANANASANPAGGLAGGFSGFNGNGFTNSRASSVGGAGNSSNSNSGSRS